MQIWAEKNVGYKRGFWVWYYYCSDCIHVPRPKRGLFTEGRTLSWGRALEDVNTHLRMYH
jgi:hypothetical protein